MTTKKELISDLTTKVKNEPATEDDYSFYLKLGEWSIEDAIWLLTRDTEKVRRLYDLIEAGRNSEELIYSRYDLPPMSYDGTQPVILYYYDPFTLVDYVISKEDKEIKEFPLSAEVLEWHAKRINPVPQNLPSYLDTNHPLHSPELKIAIEHG